MSDEEIVSIDYHRETWGDGPWIHEPDRFEWRAYGLPCLIVRNQVGAWCGYVGVPPGHPWHGQDYEHPDVRVHGGLTYANRCANHICHIQQDGEPADVWWLGFDCSHAFDLVPYTTRRIPGEVYRDQAYVMKEVEQLAAQIQAAA